MAAGCWLLVAWLRRQSEARRPLRLLTGQPDGSYCLPPAITTR
ncbi:hypothetical protein [Hymenobacter rubripertinctus]|nr:hypothetical protein [Hymenobacter rubripertinctus]